MDRTYLGRAPAVTRRPAAGLAQRSFVPTRSPMRALQERIGSRATQAVVMRSLASAHVPLGPQAVSITNLKVSHPSDRAEVEAESVARSVVRMPDHAAREPVSASAGGTLHRAEAQAAPAPPASPRTTIPGGTPLSAPVRNFMEPRFGASFGAVRVHTGPNAAQQSASLNARAFTVGEHIFFGKDQYQPQTQKGKELLAHELTHTVQQGAVVQRAAIPATPAPVAERVTPHVQRLFGLKNPREYFADKAAIIPGYTMLTVVIGVNPISGAKVERSAGNILKGARLKEVNDAKKSKQ